MQMNETLINALQRQLGPANVLFGPTVLAKYALIWGLEEPLEAQAIVCPNSTAALSGLLKHCNRHQQPVAIWDGGLSAVGAIKIDGSEIIVSMEKMTTIEAINKANRTILVQSGVQLAAIQQAAEEKDLFFPLSENLKKATPINELLAISRAGTLVIKRQQFQNLLVDIELVLGDGTIVSSLKQQVQSRLIDGQLIGKAAGKQGIITKVILKLLEK